MNEQQPEQHETLSQTESLLAEKYQEYVQAGDAYTEYVESIESFTKIADPERTRLF